MDRTTRYEYDKRGNRTSTIRDAGGQNWTTTRKYDALGRVIKTTDSREGSHFSEGINQRGMMLVSNIVPSF